MKLDILKCILRWDKWSYDCIHHTIIGFTCNYMNEEGNTIILGYKPKQWVDKVSLADFGKLICNKKIRTDFTFNNSYFYETFTIKAFIKKYGM